MKYLVSSMKSRKKDKRGLARVRGSIHDTRYTIHDERGFTLVEMIVAVALFAIVMLVSVGALLSLTAANRKAQALQSVMNNLNIALDGMVRSIRMGTMYHGAGGDAPCGNSDYTVPADCPNGGTVFAFEPFGGDPSKLDDQKWVYSYDSNAGRIYKSEKSGISDTFIPVTAPEITITDMKFYVVGTARDGDTTQPKVVITVSGTAGAANVKTRTSFSLQATAVQRVLDL